MVRGSDDPAAGYMLLALSPPPAAGGDVATLRALWRRDQGRPFGNVVIANVPDRAVASLPIYLRIERVGDLISLQRSPDGVTYTTVASKNILLPGETTTAKIVLGTDALLGIGVTSTGVGSTRARFSQVSGPPFTGVVLGAPSNLVAVGGVKSVALSWSAPAGTAPDGYAVYRSANQGGPYAKVADVAASPTSYTDGGLADSTAYCYLVRSKAGAVESSDSNTSCDTTKPGGQPTFRRGDADANGNIDVTDAVNLLNFLFLGGPKPQCLDASDFDDSGLADISDAVANLSYQFLGGVASALPGPLNCGPDAILEAPDLGCDVGCR
jgi:hypothetical protein